MSLFTVIPQGNFESNGRKQLSLSSCGWVLIRSGQFKITGCMVPMAKKPRVPLSAKNARGVLLACRTGKVYSRIVRTKIQHLPPEAAKGRQSGGIKGGSTSVPQIVLSFFIEKMRKERKCAAVLFTDSVFAEVALGGLLPFDTREQLFDKAGLSGQIWQVLRDLLAEDAVVTAEGLEQVWRRAAQDWHTGCSFGVKGKEVGRCFGRERGLVTPWQI